LSFERIASERDYLLVLGETEGFFRLTNLKGFLEKN